jgi:enediyne biosynthesis protein E4
MQGKRAETVAGLVAAVLGGSMLVLGVVTFDAPAAHAPAPPVPVPRFVEEAEAAGIHHVYDGDFKYVVGGGVAAFDCDGSGLPSLYLAGGANPAALYHNESTAAQLRFRQIPSPVTDMTAVVGAYPIDIDGDGIIDLVVLRTAGNVLLRGLGNCRFEVANARWGFQGGNSWTTAFSAKWEGADRLPTLAFGNYIDLARSKDRATCADNQLVRPEPGATTYAAPVALSPGWCTLSLLFSDWDRSGRRDLRVSNDRHYYGDGGEEQLWRVADGQAPHLYTEAEGWQPLQIWGMGIASFNVTGDRRPEYFLTSEGDNKLQTLADRSGRPTYRDIALKRGVTAPEPYAGGDALASTAWHAQFEDVNNSGFVSLFITKGNVESEQDTATKDPSDLLIGQPDGTFKEGGQAAGIVQFVKGRGAAVVDLNGDGMLDIVQVNRGSNVTLWRNVGSGDSLHPSPMGGWIEVRPQQAGPNRDAIGSWIDVRFGGRTLERELTIGGGHASGQLGWLHFGLGYAESAQVRVQWPDGTIGPWMDLRPGQRATIVRGASAPEL